MHTIAVAASRLERLVAALKIAHRVQQAAPKRDNANIARAQVLLRPIRDGPTVLVLLNRYVFLTDTAHAGKNLGALSLSIEEVIVPPIGDGLEGPRIDLSVGASNIDRRPNCAVRQSLARNPFPRPKTSVPSLSHGRAAPGRQLRLRTSRAETHGEEMRRDWSQLRPRRSGDNCSAEIACAHRRDSGAPVSIRAAAAPASSPGDPCTPRSPRQLRA